MHLIVLVLLLNTKWISTFSLPASSTRQNDEELFRLMYEAQYSYRHSNYGKSIRTFETDWENCDEKYKWPACCLWSEKKKFKRSTSDCEFIKGDVILENDRDANLFQSQLEIREIQGSLVLRNTTILAFGLPQLRKIGFHLDSNKKNRPKAALIIENNHFLSHLRLRRLQKISKHKTQKYAIIKGNEYIKVDAKQYEILRTASNGSKDFDEFKPPKRKYVRVLFYELWPFYLFGLMIIIVFAHHFIMLEVNEARTKKKEQEMNNCIVKMRDSVLAAELLIQTPRDVTLSFDTDVLHLCTDQVELIKQIEKLLNADVKAFRDISLEEVSAKDGTY